MSSQNTMVMVAYPTPYKQLRELSFSVFNPCSSHLEHRHQLTDKGAASSAQILTCGHLLEEDRDATGKHGDEVDEQKGSWCNIFYAREEIFLSSSGSGSGSKSKSKVKSQN